MLGLPFRSMRLSPGKATRRSATAPSVQPGAFDDIGNDTRCGPMICHRGKQTCFAQLAGKPAMGVVGRRIDEPVDARRVVDHEQFFAMTGRKADDIERRLRQLAIPNHLCAVVTNTPDRAR